MGNRCGDLALWSGIACGAEIVVTSDTGFDEQDVLDRLRDIDIIKKKKHAIVVISEKITDVDQFAKKVSLNTGFSGRATVLGHIQCISIRDNKIISYPIEEALSMPQESRKPLMNLFDRLV